MGDGLLSDIDREMNHQNLLWSIFVSFFWFWFCGPQLYYFALVTMLSSAAVRNL